MADLTHFRPTAPPNLIRPKQAKVILNYVIASEMPDTDGNAEPSAAKRLELPMTISTVPFAIVVDDDIMILMHGCNILSDAGFPTVEAQKRRRILMA